jgi:hypothetical protein
METTPLSGCGWVRPMGQGWEGSATGSDTEEHDGNGAKHYGLNYLFHAGLLPKRLAER